MQAPTSVRTTWSNVRATVPRVAVCLCACLWLNLNTGFWQIQAGPTLDEWQLCIRAILPFFVLPIALLALQHGPYELRLPSLSPSRLLFVYGLVAAAASFFSPEPLWALYWGIAFLATLSAAWTFTCCRDPLTSSRYALQLTWAVTFVVTLVIVYLARSIVFASGAPSEWEVLDTLGSQSRSSGVARWAAVPGLVCLLKAFHTQRRLLIAFFTAGAVGAFYVVYLMQSRGAVFGSLAALAFGLIVASRLRKYALPFLIFAGALLLVTDPARTFTGRVDRYLHRGQSQEEFRTLTGRTRAYENGLKAFREAPVLGRGNWADRLIIGEHVHNSYLQALLNAGVVGFVPYLASWIAGWVLFFRIVKKQNLLRPEHRAALVEAGTVMMFFTVRSVPETTTASYAVDLLVMAAVYVYLEQLTLALDRLDLRGAGAGTTAKRFPAQPAPVGVGGGLR
jgi:O-antigen ligase